VIQEIIIDSRPCKNPPVAIKKQMTVLIYYRGTMKHDH